MVLHAPKIAMRFADYGILIPVLDSRADAVVASLERSAPTAVSGTVVEGLEGAASLLGTTPEELAVGRADLERVHDARFIARLYDVSERGGLEKALLSTYELIGRDGKPNRYEPRRATRPLSSLFDTILAQVTGSYAAGRLALSGVGPLPGFAYFLGGGMHHARHDAGSGFCLVNDVMVSIARLRAEGRVGLVWVIDVDAHKGDGTAELAAADKDTLTLSIHMAAGWPLDSATMEQALREGRGSDRAPMLPSDVEIPIARGGEGRYVDALAEGLARLELLSGSRKPDLAIVVDGADPYALDGLPSSADLALSLNQCLKRDLLVHRFLADRGIPSAWLMAGGYGDRAWEPPANFLTAVLARDPEITENP